MKHTVVLGVTSGIAAYKSIELVGLLKKSGVDVRVIMTGHATHMVPADEFERASGHPVYVELFEKNFSYKRILKERRIEHIELADRADVMVIAPATANVIGKLAHGLADDYLTTTALAVTAPIIVCPSMNVHMWTHPVIQENITKLKKLGFIIMEPATGMLACGYEGKGRLVDVRMIKDEIVRLIERSQSLKGKCVIVTAGGTMEKLDDVRYITNRSSGKMGAAIADACYLRGADVTLIRTKNSVSPRYRMKELVFSTADELQKLIMKHVKTCDIMFHAAAVSDFRVAATRGKMSSDKAVTITLTPRTKILDTLKTKNPRMTLVAFKAEYNLTQGELVKRARKRLTESHADFIIANDISRPDRGFESDFNEVYVISQQSTIKYARAIKNEIAEKLLDIIGNEL